MPATVGWMDISPAALRKLRHALEDQPAGVVDELGLLALHTGYGDRFFPGTSVLQKRARYLFFVPWMYLSLAASSSVTAANVRDRKQKLDLRVTEQLKAQSPEPEGIIGKLTFPSPPAQPADFVYWTALRAYGFYEGIERSSLLSRWDRRRVMRRADIRVREEVPMEEPLGIFDVPEAPKGWPGSMEPLSFSLTKKEAERLREGFRRCGASLLAAAADALAARSKPSLTGAAWEDRFLTSVAESVGEQGPLLRAQRVAHLAQIARCAYAAHVEILFEADRKEAGMPPLDDNRYYRDALSELLEEGIAFERAAEVEVHAIREDIQAPLPPRLEGLIGHLRDAAGRIRRRADIHARLLDSTSRDLFQAIETHRKGTRARLHLINGRARREGFGRFTVAVEPLHYRWPVARWFLLDIHEGLFS
jgi:hypothetical protein